MLSLQSLPVIYELDNRKEWIDEEEAMILAEEEETGIEKKIDNTTLNGDDRKSELSDKSMTLTDGNLLDNKSHQAIHSNIVARTQSALPSQHKSNSLFDMIGSSIMQTALAPSLEDLHRGKAFSFSRFVEKTLPSPIVSNGATNRKLSGSENTGWSFSSNLSDATFSPTSAAYDSNLGLGHRLSRMLGVQSKEKEAMLIQSHYFHSEMQFVRALVETSARLVNVPRPARQSSLEAELTLLNHNLPADVCIPLWCPATGDRTHRHHQVVRIPIKEVTVLNSADRVPYLLLVEVLDNDGNDATDIRELQKESDVFHKLNSTPLQTPGLLPTAVTPIPEPAIESLNIDVEDTDELFGGVYFKRQKMIQNREKNIPFIL